MTSPARVMRVMRATSPDPASLADERIPVPEPGPGELLVEVRATAVTAGELDWPETWPAIPCHDLSGVVAATGPGVTGWQAGDEIYGLVGFDRPGAAAGYVLAPAADLAPKPAAVDHVQAAAVPLGALTAWQALHEHARLQPGQHVLVHGGAGGVGGYVVQLAKAEGLTVIADASEKDEKLVASLGADIVVRRGDDVASRIREHFPQGVDGLADGAVLKELVIPAVRDGGAFNSVRGFQGIPQRDIHFTATRVTNYAQAFEKLDRLRQQVEAGEITLRVAEVYPPERAADAHRRLEAGGTRGRLVIQF